MDADQSSLERFSVPESIRHEDGLVWFRRSLVEGGDRHNPNAKHLQSLNKQYREERKR